MDTWINAATSIGTLLAVAVALFREELRNYWHKPELKVRVSLRPPDCHKTPMARVQLHTGEILHKADSYYLRLWVQNDGDVRAEKVQVYMEELARKKRDGTFAPVETFLPMNLKWSHTGEIFAGGISPHMGKHCDFAHLIDPAEAANFGALIDHVEAGQTIVSFDLEFESNTGSHMAGPGTYRIKLRVGCANAKPVVKCLELTLDGRWFADEERMFSEGLGLVEISGP